MIPAGTTARRGRPRAMAWWCLGLALLTLACAASGSATGQLRPDVVAAAPPAEEVGFIVAVPDRGFLGNEELADAFAELARAHVAALVYVTDERTRGALAAAVTELAARGVERVVVLPLFLTGAEVGFQRLARAVAPGGWRVPVTLGDRFGRSYLAVELLADRFRTITAPAGRRVVVVGHGAGDPASVTAMTTELQRLADQAAQGFGFESVRVLAWRDRSAAADGDRQAAATLGGLVAGGPRPVVVPFQLGPKLDSMMSFAASLARELGAVERVEADLTPDPLVGLWMIREANRHRRLEVDDVGVVFLAHGSDHHWNQGMRAAVAGLAARYRVEFAFCMADAALVERAIRRLEARGARAVVVVRVFGLARSFRASVDRMLGLDVEGTDPPAHAGHGDGHGHGHGPAGPPPPRLRIAARAVSVGGLEDSPHFAAALLDRALAMSREPARETVILVAHGAGDDPSNDHWRQRLASLARTMRAGAGAKFRAIEVGTWREDWPAQRAPEVAAIRGLVEVASADGGRALVIPARTTGQGPEAELLAGLRYQLGHGFAPHPRFERWVEEQIGLGLEALGAVQARPAAAAPPAPPAHLHDERDHGHH